MAYPIPSPPTPAATVVRPCGVKSETNEEDDDVDKQRIGESITDAPVRELGPVDEVAVTMAVLHHRRRRFNGLIVANSFPFPPSHHHGTDVSLKFPELRQQLDAATAQQAISA